MDEEDINTIAVLGAGNMGHGIAEVAAIAGYDVTMRDINDELVQEGYDQIEWSLGKLAEKDRLEADDPETVLSRITPLVDVEEAVSAADVVIEAVPERMDIKTEVYQEVEQYAPDHAIFATNTSSLSVTELSEVTERPEQFCGMHFFNPPVRMQLVEVISGAHTDEGVLDTIETLARSMGKSPVRVRKDSPGFIVNRVLVPLMNEAAWMVHEGEASVAAIDSTASYEMGLPMGLFELTDQVGLDVGLHVQEYMHEVLGEAYAPCPMTEQKVEAGELGKKTGKGVYDYEDGDGAQIPPDAGEEWIADRCLAVMANEVAQLVSNEVADPGSIDEAMKLGAGFPDGPAKMADNRGLEDLLSALEDAHEKTDAPRHEPSEAFRKFAEAGSFYDKGADGVELDPEGDRFEYDAIAVEIEDSVGRITIDRPHRMNTITTDMIEEIDDALDRLVELEVRAILLTGEGDRAFSAGFDASTAAAGNGIEAADLSRRGQEVFGRFEELPVPVLAAIDGYCLGGGMELATCADIRLASERSQFGQPEHNLGLLPGWGGTQRLSRVVGEGRAKEIIFTARNDYDPETMYDYDFVNEVVPTDAFEDRVRELIEDLAAGPPIAQRFTKRAMLVGRDDFDAGLALESSSFGHLFTTDDLWEGLAAFQQDREPEFEGE